MSQMTALFADSFKLVPSAPIPSRTCKPGTVRACELMPVIQPPSLPTNKKSGQCGRFKQ